MRTKSTKYPLLNDKEWLYNQYINQNLSTGSIAKIVNCKRDNSVIQALKRHSIPIRILEDSWEYYHGVPMNFDMDIINGSMLGDGYMRKWKKDSESAKAYFAKTNKFIDHVNLVANAFFPDDYDNRIKSKIDKCNGKLFTYYTFSTPVHIKLKAMYEE